MEQIDIFTEGVSDTHYQYASVFSEKDYPLRLFETFAGIGCQRMALNRLKIPYVSVGVSEIDKYALMSYKAIHGDCKNYGDITKMTYIPDCDILTYSFPCTDLSKAGKQEGLKEGTRSNLVYEVLRLLKLTPYERRPRVLIMENVVDLVQVKFAAQFWEICKDIEKLGYENKWKVLNAKDFGVAQNRERVFMVSILGGGRYEFPIPFPLEKRLKDYLEPQVDEKYYISNKMLKGFIAHKERNEEKGNGFGFNPRTQDDIGFTIKTTAGSRPDDNFIEEPITLEKINENYSQLNGGKWEKMNDIGRRVYNPEYVSPIIHTMGGGNLEPKIIEPSYRIRKLTPLETWRLMGISDSDFRKAEKVCSNSQLYKQAGNGIVVDVFAQIITGLIPQRGKEKE